MVEILPFIGKFYNDRLEKGLVHTAMSPLYLCLKTYIELFIKQKQTVCMQSLLPFICIFAFMSERGLNEVFICSIVVCC